MSETSLQFANNTPAWMVLAITLLALLPAVWFYVRARTLLTPGRIAALSVLRALWVLVVLLLFFQPVVRTVRTEVRKLKLALVVDSSSSMSIQDLPNLGSRLSRVKAALQPDSRTGKLLEQFFEVDVVTFDSKPSRLKGLEQLGPVAPAGESTDMASALEFAGAGGDARTMKGVVLFGDGIDNSGNSPTQVSQELPVPVYTVGVGTRLKRDGSFVDVNVADVKVTPAGDVAVNHEATVEVELESWGLQQTVVPVSITDDRGRQVVPPRQVVLKSTEGRQTEKFTIQCKEVGRFLYTVSVPEQKDETILKNNSATVALNVTAPKIKVLYLDKARAESKYLARNFQLDPNAEVLTFRVIAFGKVDRQGSITGKDIREVPSDKAGFREFDVIVLGDIDVKSPLLVGRLTAIREAAEDGTGVIFIGGNNAFEAGGYGQSPLVDLFPMELGQRPTGEDDGQIRQPFRLQLTDRGTRDPIFTGYVNLLTGDEREALPELQGCNRVGQAKDLAEVLAVNPKATVAGNPLPVLASMRFGKGMVVAFTADSTWKWYFQMMPFGRKSPYVKFWSQMLRFAARRDLTEGPAEPGVKGFTDAGYYDSGKTVSFTASVTSQEGQKPKEPAVTVTITRPDGKTETMNLGRTAEEGVLDGRYKPETDLSGVYEAKLIGSDRGQEVGTQTVKFIIGKPNKEFERLDFDEDLLKTIARQGKAGREGRQAYFKLVDLEELLAQLGGTADRREQRSTFAPWNRPWLLFPLFVLVIAAEWFLRKHWQLI